MLSGFGVRIEKITPYENDPQKSTFNRKTRFLIIKHQATFLTVDCDEQKHA